MRPSWWLGITRSNPKSIHARQKPTHQPTHSEPLVRPASAPCSSLETPPPYRKSFVEAERPSRLVIEELGTVQLESNDGSTCMTVSIRCASQEHLEQFLKLGVNVGTARTLDNLVEHLRPGGCDGTETAARGLIQAT